MTKRQTEPPCVAGRLCSCCKKFIKHNLSSFYCKIFCLKGGGAEHFCGAEPALHKKAQIGRGRQGKELPAAAGEVRFRLFGAFSLPELKGSPFLLLLRQFLFAFGRNVVQGDEDAALRQSRAAAAEDAQPFLFPKIVQDEHGGENVELSVCGKFRRRKGQKLRAGEGEPLFCGGKHLRRRVEEDKCFERNGAESGFRHPSRAAAYIQPADRLFEPPLHGGGSLCKICIVKRHRLTDLFIVVRR